MKSSLLRLRSIELGPGLLESAYRACLCHELKIRQINYEKELSIPITYKGESLDIGFRLDLLVEDQVLIELKAVEILLPVHEAQLLTYLRLLNKQVGLLINFQVPILKNGIRRCVLNAKENYESLR